MTFLYRTSPTGAFPDDNGAWQSACDFGHRLDFRPRPDSVFAKLQTSEFAPGERTSAWLVIEGYPVLTSLSDSAGNRLRELARDLYASAFAIDRWRGAFVAMLIIPERGIAICARDCIGGRTAYYLDTDCDLAISNSAWLLASTRGAIKEAPGFIAPRFTLRKDRPPRGSAFLGVSELLPGERLAANGRTVRLDRRPLKSPPVFAGKPADRPAELGRRFRTAVARALPAEGPVAVMLSGGLDSAPVASLAARALQSTGQELHAISWRLPGFPACDESRWIRDVAHNAGIELHEFDGDISTPFSILDSSAVHPDFPAYNALRHLFNGCYETASRLGIPVLLNAAAGDAVYPGYDVVLVDLFRRRRLGHFAARAIREIARSRSRVHRNWALRGFARYMLDGPDARQRAPMWLTLYASSVLEQQDFWSWLPEATTHGVSEYFRTLFGLGATGGVKYEIDMSGAFGIARRDPFYDLDLLKFYLATPPWMAISGKWNKWMMREAMKGILPEAVRTKGKTGLLNAFFRDGFQRQLPRLRERLMDTPVWSRWVRRDFVENALSPDSPESSQMVITACLGYVLWRERIRENPFA